VLTVGAEYGQNQCWRASARNLEIERLYLEGRTLQQTGAHLKPQGTLQRIGQLFREGATLGLYLMPRCHAIKT